MCKPCTLKIIKTLEREIIKYLNTLRDILMGCRILIPHEANIKTAVPSKWIIDNAISIKILTGFFEEIDKVILNFIRTGKDLE